MKKRYLFMLALFVLPFAAGAQATEAGTFSDTRVTKDGNTVNVHATYDLNGKLFHQDMILLTPVLRSLDGRESVRFDPLLVTGRTRDRVLRRNAVLHNNYGYELPADPSRTVVYHKRDWQPVDIDLQTPYSPWMRQAELVMEEQYIGCRYVAKADNQYRLLTPVLPALVAPKFQITYAEPPTEAVKQRSEAYAARLNFQVNRYEILQNFMNNAAVLNEVDRIIGEVRNDKNLTINEFKVTGYASPEGAAASNLKLSENRAKAFVDYIRSKHGIAASLMQVDWRGDDWEGLRKLMQESNFPEKARVLDILNSTSDPQQRKDRLKAMGTAYRTLLAEYYPQLRRNEYTIAYVARPFSVEEAKALIKTKPQQLSLNEMFLVANSYPKGSAQFKEVFDIASRLYPESGYANLNSGALEIEQGAYDAALTRLSKVDMPQAWNNMGYIYYQKKDYTRAAEYFKRAGDAGLQAARQNLSELNRWLAETK